MIRYIQTPLLCTALITVFLNHTAFAADPSTGATKNGNPAFFEKHAAFLRRANEGPVGLALSATVLTKARNL